MYGMLEVQELSLAIGVMVVCGVYITLLVFGFITKYVNLKWLKWMDEAEPLMKKIEHYYVLCRSKLGAGLMFRIEDITNFEDLCGKL